MLRIEDPILQKRSYTTATSGVEDSPLVTSTDYVRIVSENPTTNSSVRIQFNTVSSEPVEVAIYNVAGRRVKVVAARTERTGVNEVVWNAIDEQGQSLPSGVYLVQMTGERQLAATRVVLLR